MHKRKYNIKLIYLLNLVLLVLLFDSVNGNDASTSTLTTSILSSLTNQQTNSFDAQQTTTIPFLSTTLSTTKTSVLVNKECKI